MVLNFRHFRVFFKVLHLNISRYFETLDSEQCNQVKSGQYNIQSSSSNSIVQYSVQCNILYHIVNSIT